VGVGSESGERGAGSGSECESGEWGARLRGRRMGAAAVCDARDDDGSGAVGNKSKQNWEQGEREREREREWERGVGARAGSEERG